MRALRTLGITVVGGVFGWAASMVAGVPHTFVNGQVADATEVNANFAALANTIGTGEVLSRSANFNVATDESGALFLVSGTTTATLPDAAGAGSGFRVTVKRTGSAQVDIVGGGSDTIDGDAQLLLLETGASVTLVSDGSGWHSILAEGKMSDTLVYASCKEILDNLGGGNGNYTIDPDGPTGDPAFTVFCDMAGGGWTYVSNGVPIEFNTCGATGGTPPNQGQCDTEYTGNAFLDGKVGVTSGLQSWTVPVSGVYRFTAYGADGGTSGDSVGAKGLGSTAAGELALVQGDTLYFAAGQAGLQGQTIAGGEGGFNGGGAGGQGNNSSFGAVGGGGGGGASDVRLNANALTDRILVAAGGGGGAHWPNAAVSSERGDGGNGGFTNGTDGVSTGGASCTGKGAGSGSGGTGGNCMSGSLNGSDGALGVGGAAGIATSSNGGGGGGGGGLYGGGGGNGQNEGGGGGGSSFVGSLANATANNGVSNPAGRITVVFK